MNDTLFPKLKGYTYLTLKKLSWTVEPLDTKYIKTKHILNQQKYKENGTCN